MTQRSDYFVALQETSTLSYKIGTTKTTRYNNTTLRTSFRASAFRSGLTESSKSNVSTSAGLDSAFLNAEGRQPGVKRTERRGCCVFLGGWG